jgi:chromosome segregation ATPase
MTDLNKKREAEIYDLSNQEVANHTNANFKAMMSMENQHRQKALVSLMLDTYKQKLESGIRKESEEKFRNELDRKLEVAHIKSSYESLHFEREKIRIRDLEQRLQKSQKQIDDLRKILDLAKEAKNSVDIALVHEKNKVQTLEDSNKKLSDECACVRTELVSFHEKYADLSDKNARLLENIARLNSQITKQENQINELEKKSQRSFDSDSQEFLMSQTIAQLRSELEMVLESKAKLSESNAAIQKTIDQYAEENERMRLKHHEFTSIIHAQKCTLEDAKQLKVLSDEKNASLLALNDKLSRDITQYANALKERDREIQEIKVKFEEYQVHVSKNTDKMQNENYAIRRSIEEAYSRIDEKDIHVKELEDSVLKLRKENESLTSLNHTNESNLSALRASYEAEKTALQHQKNILTSANDSMKVKVDELAGQLVKMYDVQKIFQDENAKLKDDSKAKEEYIDAIHKELSFAKENQSQLLQQSKTLKEQVDSNNWEMSFLKKHIKELNEKYVLEIEQYKTKMNELESVIIEKVHALETLERKILNLTDDAFRAHALQEELCQKNDELVREKGMLETRLKEAVADYDEKLRVYAETNKSFQMQVNHLDDTICHLKQQVESLTHSLKAKESHNVLLESKVESLVELLNQKENALYEIREVLQKNNFEKETSLLKVKQLEDCLNGKENEIKNHAQTIKDLFQKIDRLQADIEQFKHVNDAQKEDIHVLRSSYAELESHSRQLLSSRAHLTQELQRLTIKHTTANESIQTLRDQFEKEMLNRIQSEKTALLFEERSKYSDSIIAELRTEIQRQKDIYVTLKDEFDLFRHKAEEETEQLQITVTSLELHNNRNLDTIKKLSEELKRIEELEVEKKSLQSYIEECKQKISDTQNQLYLEKVKNDEIRSNIEQEKAHIQQIIHEKDTIVREKKNLEETVNTYMNSIDDMSMLISAEKERNSHLERERTHLKKCLEIAQRAFTVNKGIANLKSDDIKQ